MYIDIIEKRLDLCGDIEKQTVFIYHTLEARFPEARAVFNGLALSEENHARLIEKATLSHKRQVLPPAFVPNSTLELEHTLYHLEKTTKLLPDVLGLKEVCSLSLQLEDLVGEKYLQEVIQGKIEMELDKEMSALLRTLSDEERAHSEIIKEFMASRNFLSHK